MPVLAGRLVLHIHTFQFMLAKSVIKMFVHPPVSGKSFSILYCIFHGHRSIIMLWHGTIDMLKQGCQCRSNLFGQPKFLKNCCSQ